MNNKIVIFIAIIFLLFPLKFFENNQMMSAGCMSAYPSGAANFINGKWEVNIPEMEHFSDLSPEDKINYRFNKHEDNYPYGFNAIGLMYINVLSRNLFFWQGDLQSLISLQQLVHILLSLFIILLLKTFKKRLLFYFLYAANPLVLYLVDFPYYYFWQVIPTAAFLIYLLRGKKIGNAIFILSVVFSFIVITRPSVLFLVVFILCYIGYKEGKIKGFFAILLFFLLAFLMKPDAHYEPWHTMYIGVGAYENPYNIALRDASGFDKFQTETGKVIEGCENSFSEEKIELFKNYSNGFIKNEYLSVLKESPFLLLKNAILNTLESFGIGYKYEWTMFNYLSALVGLALILMLLFYKEYGLFFAIGISSLSFTPYFPPVAVYMFGSYILIIYAWILIIDKLRRKKVL